MRGNEKVNDDLRYSLGVLCDPNENRCVPLNVGRGGGSEVAHLS